MGGHYRARASRHNNYYCLSDNRAGQGGRIRQGSANNKGGWVSGELRMAGDDGREERRRGGACRIV